MTCDKSHARMYANECAEIRKMYTTAKSVQLALERVVVRLDTIIQFGEAVVELAPIMDVVRGTKGSIVGLVPEVAGELDKVASMLFELGEEVGQVTQTDLEIRVTSEEAKRILEVSKSIADEKVREKFPELPVSELTAAPTETRNESSGDKPDPSFLDVVLFYIESHAGQVSVSECASKLSKTPEDVIKAIDQLREVGRLDVVWEKE